MRGPSSIRTSTKSSAGAALHLGREGTAAEDKEGVHTPRCQVPGGRETKNMITTSSHPGTRTNEIYQLAYRPQLDSVRNAPPSLTPQQILLTLAQKVPNFRALDLLFMSYSLMTGFSSGTSSSFIHELSVLVSRPENSEMQGRGLPLPGKRGEQKTQLGQGGQTGQGGHCCVMMGVRDIPPAAEPS